MYCGNCGKELSEYEKVCPICNQSINDNKNEDFLDVDFISTADEGVTDELSEFGTCVDVKEDESVSNMVDEFHKKRTLIKFVAIAFSVIGVCICAAMLIYFNSDSYKIKKSVDLILEGDTISATKVVYDVYDPRASAIRDFILVENAKDEFIENMENSSDLQTVNNSFLSFREAVYDFSSVEYKYTLPQELNDLYNMYYAGVTYAENVAFGSEGAYENSLRYVIGGVQSVFLNKPTRNSSSKGGNTFTLKQMEDNMDSTSENIKYLQENNYLQYITVNDYKVKEFCYTENNKIPTSKSLYNHLLTLCMSADAELISEIRYIENNKKWDKDDELYMISPDSTVVSEISNDFEPVKTSEQINNNTNKVVNILKCDLLYYMLTGEVSVKKY